MQMRWLIPLVVAFASSLTAQGRVPGVGLPPGTSVPPPTSAPPANIIVSGLSRGILTINALHMPYDGRAEDLEKINCHLASSNKDVWVIRCESDDTLNGKDRTFTLSSRRNDGSGCAVTVRFNPSVAKWDVQVGSRLGAPCVHRWLDDSTVEFKEG